MKNGEEGFQATAVVEGPFRDLDGTVAEVKPQEGKVRVLISRFGRAYPPKLDLVQVENC